jgi:hypothetical protein
MQLMMQLHCKLRPDSGHTRRVVAVSPAFGAVYSLNFERHETPRQTSEEQRDHRYAVYA